MQSEATLELVRSRVHFRGHQQPELCPAAAGGPLECSLQVLTARTRELTTLAHQYADLAMPARTHGQLASPTTLGKELANFAVRCTRATVRWQSVQILGKWNGAVGNFNAHIAALPTVDWPRIASAFVRSLGLEYNPLTTLKIGAPFHMDRRVV